MAQKVGQDLAAGKEMLSQRAVHNRLAFTGDVVTTIFKGSVFITSSMSFDPMTHVDPFIGIGDLHAVIMERVKEVPVVIPEKAKGKKADKKAVKKKRAARLSGESEEKQPDSHDINFFLFMAPYMIPSEILARMIIDERQKALRKR
jgi:hypothetical protein